MAGHGRLKNRTFGFWVAQVAFGWRWFWVTVYATYATMKHGKPKNAKYNATYATYATQSPQSLDLSTFFGWRSGWRRVAYKDKNTKKVA